MKSLVSSMLCVYRLLYRRIISYFKNRDYKGLLSLRFRVSKKNTFPRSLYSLAGVLVLFILYTPHSLCQDNNKLTRKDDYTSLYLLNPGKNNGFEISISAVLMFTTGAADRNGFRWGGGITLSKDIGDFSLTSGLDLYKARQEFGLGTTFAGIRYNDGQYGFSYYLNKYYQGDRQVSGILGINLGDFLIRFEDDILALPFTGFTIYDRYRTAALELHYRNFLIGTNVYTNEVNGLMDVSTHNPKGTYYTGKQISSPVFVGYTNKNLIVRYGVNSNLGGFLGQNWWHRTFFDTSDYNYGEYKNQFLQVGVNKPYTLY